MDGLLPMNPDELPSKKRALAELITADMLQNGIAFFDWRTDAEGFRAAFAAAARHPDVALFARGSMVCLALEKHCTTTPTTPAQWLVQMITSPGSPGKE